MVNQARRRGRSTADIGSNSPPRSRLPSLGSVPGSSSSDAHRELVNELRTMAWKLAAVYCVCLTVQSALEGQAADHDPEFARCLRSGVADSVSRQVERLHFLVERFGGKSPSASP
jgi:hypothetical protein